MYTNFYPEIYLQHILNKSNKSTDPIVTIRDIENLFGYRIVELCRELDQDKKILKNNDPISIDEIWKNYSIMIYTYPDFDDGIYKINIRELY